MGKSTKKRKNSKKILHHDLNEYFMAMAILSMQYSTRHPKVGACIVDDDNRIVGTGYNELPSGCFRSEYTVCHAEANAIIKKTGDVRNGTMYVTLFPCLECAKLIIQSGIRTVIYKLAKDESQSQVQTVKMMFEDASVTYRQYKQTKPENLILITL